MNFQSKIAILIVAGSACGAMAYPMVAAAVPATGSTAAAVSIKFQKHGGNGSFSINPGGNANGNGNGVQELSAAVATGETDAQAKSQSGRNGTSANASGYSAPVFLKYETHNDLVKKDSAAVSAYQTAYQQDAAIEFAAGQKNSQSRYSSETEGVSVTRKGGKLINLSKAEIEIAKSKQSSEANLKLSASTGTSATTAGHNSTSSQYSNKEVGTSYVYTGSSTGLQFLPAIVK